MLIVKVVKPLVSTNRIPDLNTSTFRLCSMAAPKKLPSMPWVPSPVIGHLREQFRLEAAGQVLSQ